MNKNPYKNDVSVLMLFFNRPDHLKEVFDEVKKARPARLFLYQDGPRRSPLPTSPGGGACQNAEDWDKTQSKDWAGIVACREIVSDENIDWECEVHRLYQEKNYGCDPSEYMSQKWAFSMTDKCIVLEDDDVPSQSFFPFCKELLDKYENDDRVWMIAGFNSEEIVPLLSPEGEDKNAQGRKASHWGGLEGASYFFTSVFSIWGWASWKRVIDTWDADYSWLEDKDKLAKVERVIKEKKLRSDFLPMCRDHKAAGKAFYESIFWASMLLNDGIAIMPTYNLINNRGVTDDSTHFQGSLKTMPHNLRKQFSMQRFEIKFPLVHPTKVVEYKPFKEAVYKRNAWGHPWVKIGYSLEELVLNLRYGNFGVITKAFRKRVNKWLGRDKHK